MRTLLDTHTVLWFLNGSEKLPSHSRNIIMNTDNTCYVSMASFWEISIKVSIGRLSVISKLETLFSEIERSDFTILNVNQNHLLEVAKLPFHHKDPFDRLLIAQSKVENLTLISKDSKFAAYNISLLWNK